MAYIFEPQKLQEIGTRAVGKPFDEMVRSVIDDLDAAYHGHIETRKDWFFNLAGGITGIMTVLHGSLSEYLLLFGSPTGSEGFSGRYRIDIWDVVLAGEMECYTDDRPGELQHYQPGDMALLRRGTTKAVRIGKGNWLLEYGRGPVPTCLPMALGDATFSALDGSIIVKTLRVYGRLVIKELLKGKI